MMVRTSNSKVRLRGATIQGVLSAGTVLTLTAALMLVGGCPIVQPPPAGPACTTDADCSGDTAKCRVDEADANNNVCVACLADADCDDAAFCNGAETCDTAAGTCSAGTAPCTADQSCNEDTDACQNLCTDDAGCDDGVFCNGAETCDADGVCQNGTDPCAAADAAGAVCDETNSACVGCLTDADCADDSLFCTGDESCDTDTNECVSSGDPCADGETCNEDAGTCDVAACTVDADCDNGFFCDGLETCDTTAGACVAGTDPCADTACVCAGETQTPICAEGDTAASCSCPDCAAIDFTLGSDNLNGSTGDDIFDASLEFNAPSGNQEQTFQTGDRANGLAGNDTLNAFLNGTAVVPTSVEGIEMQNFTVFAATTLTATNITNVDRISTVNSVAALAVNAIQELVDGGVTNVLDGTLDPFAFTFAQTGTTSGSTDTFGLWISDSIIRDVTVTTPGANGFETLHFNSGGTTPNEMREFLQAGGTSMVNGTFDGPNDLKVQEIPETILSIDGSTMTGGLTLGNGTDASTYVDFTNGAGNVAYNGLLGGPGDDVIIMGGQFDSNDFNGTTELLDLGGGNDVLQASFAATFGPPLPIANVEEFRVNATGNGVNLNLPSGPTMLTIEEDGTANTLTFNNVAGLPALNYRGDNTAAAQTFDTVTYNGSGLTGAGDTLSVTVGNRGTALNTGSSTANVCTLGPLVIPTVEIINFTCSDGPCKVTTGLTASTLTTLNCTGSSNVDLTSVSATADTITTLSASAVTGNFTAIVNAFANGASATLGAGNDTLNMTGSAAGANSNSISLGAGNDVFTGSQSQDIVTTGGGNDTITYAAANEFGDIITDFTAGSDRIDYNVTLNSKSDSAAITFESGAANTVIAVGTTIFELTGVTVASQTAANVVTALGTSATDAAFTNTAPDSILLVVYTTGGGAAVWQYVSTGANITAGELTLVATLSSVVADSLTAADFL